MYCNNCGKDNPEGAAFCEGCGVALETEETTEVTENIETGAEENAASQGGDINNLPNKNKILGIAAVVVVAIVVLFGAKSLFFEGWEKPVKQLFRAMNNEKAETYMKTLPKKMEKKVKKDKDEKEQIEDILENTKESYEDKVGANAKVKYEITDKIKIDKDELEDIEDYAEESLEDYYDKVRISKGYRVALKVTLKGDDGKKEEFEELIVLKVNGDWCLIGY